MNERTAWFILFLLAQLEAQRRVNRQLAGLCDILYDRQAEMESDLYKAAGGGRATWAAAPMAA